ncbi:MAG: hypothetical protein K2X77_09200 [Candidatus Obscuribacterales bacterium]|jgi:hypothetical protein|nr:hypothetical protein [Candidatus Obscuribacterales bacterium]
MAQQRGMKRAAKVAKRKARHARQTYRSNIKQAVYAFEKALREADGGHDHVHDENCNHEH